MKKSDGFDKVAPLYDKLARIVYGGAILRSQRAFIHLIPESSRILIIGGGTGEIVPEILRLRQGVVICFIDASEKMVQRARKRCQDDERVRFIHGAVGDVANTESFDVILTAFFLDLFEQEALNNVIAEARRQMTNSGIWIAADFVREKWWHRVFLKVMYTFFRLVTGLQTSKLPDWEDALSRNGLRRIGQSDHYQGFIRSVVYLANR